MKLAKVVLHNFRAYSESTSMTVEDLTVILGQNDAGKSSILDALDIFFNEPKGSPETDDFNVPDAAEEMSITCMFEDLPSEITIDETVSTTLQDEFLLNSDGQLAIKKVYRKSGSPKVFAIADHPQNEDCSNLLTLTNAKLKVQAHKLEIDLEEVDERINSQLRRAIWDNCDDLQLGETEIELAKEAAKELWAKLKPQMPVYALFKSDRPSTDQDSEAQDPMKSAIQEAIATQAAELEEIRKKVEKQVQEIADKTVNKIEEMSPELAKELNPRVVTKKWETLFNVSLTGDEGIPINKRGSGTRRLVLLNFFRAKAEQESTNKGTGIIYAVEEPETSQHPNNQKMLMEAFEDLVSDDTCQVLLTTHTPVLARRFSRDRLRIVDKQDAVITVSNGTDEVALTRIVQTLGILPDHDVKVFVGCEGKHDISFLKTISRILNEAGEDYPDLGKAEDEGKLVFIPCGGSSVELWVSRLKELNIPEYHIFDRDTPPGQDPHYKEQADQINVRENAEAVHTSKRELENYLHPDIIMTALPTYTGPTTIGSPHDECDVPNLVAAAKGIREKKAKRWLNGELVGKMTPHLLTQVDPDGDIRGWLTSLKHKLER